MRFHFKSFNSDWTRLQVLAFWSSPRLRLARTWSRICNITSTLIYSYVPVLLYSICVQVLLLTTTMVHIVYLISLSCVVTTLSTWPYEPSISKQALSALWSAAGLTTIDSIIQHEHLVPRGRVAGNSTCLGALLLTTNVNTSSLQIQATIESR